MSALLTLKHVTAGYVADIDILRCRRVGRGERDHRAHRPQRRRQVDGHEDDLRFPAAECRGHPLHGRDITGIAPHRVIDNGIYYIPQESSLFPYMSVDDNLRLPLEHLSRSQACSLRGESEEPL